VDPEIEALFKAKVSHSYDPRNLPRYYLGNMRQPFFNNGAPVRIFDLLNDLIGDGVEPVQAVLLTSLTAVETGGLYLNGETQVLDVPYAVDVRFAAMLGQGVPDKKPGAFERLLPDYLWPDDWLRVGTPKDIPNNPWGTIAGAEPTFASVALANPPLGSALSLIYDADVVTYMHECGIASGSDLIDVANTGANLRKVFEYVLIRKKAALLDSFHLGPYRLWLGNSVMYKNVAGIPVTGTEPIKTWGDLVNVYIPDNRQMVTQYATEYTLQALAAAGVKLGDRLNKPWTSWGAAETQLVLEFLQYHNITQHRNMSAWDMSNVEPTLDNQNNPTHGSVGGYLAQWVTSMPGWVNNKPAMWAAWPIKQINNNNGPLGVDNGTWSALGKLASMVAGEFAGAALSLLGVVVGSSAATVLRTAMQYAIGYMHDTSWNALASGALNEMAKHNTPLITDVNGLQDAARADGSMSASLLDAMARNQ